MERKGGSLEAFLEAACSASQRREIEATVHGISCVFAWKTKFLTGKVFCVGNSQKEREK